MVVNYVCLYVINLWILFRILDLVGGIIYVCRCLTCLWYLEGENKETLVYKQSDHGIDLSKNRLVFHISIITEIL